MHASVRQGQPQGKSDIDASPMCPAPRAGAPSAVGWDALEQRARGLAEEASSLVRTNGTLGLGWLDSAAAWLAGVSGSWEELTGEVPSERTYHLLVSSLHMEAWLICWPETGRLAMHDHGGAPGALRVVSGQLQEVSCSGVRPVLRRRELGPGDGISFDGHYVHDVTNERRVPATSVHVYGAASRPMAFWQWHPAYGRLVRVAGSDYGTVAGAGQQPA